MKVVKWLDEHFEEAIIVFLLAVICVVELMQVVCRNVPFIPSLTWAEELCRYAWIATVFLSLPYTFRTGTALKVTALVELFPWKVTNAFNIAVDLVTAAMMIVLGVASITTFGNIYASGEVSPAMQWPMWWMYAIVVVGFFLGAVRSIEMFVIHIKNFNVPPVNSVEEAAAFEMGGVGETKDMEVTVDNALDSMLKKEGGAA